MAAPTANKDKQVPWTKEKVGEVVLPPGFETNIHIFWGPGQLTTPPGDTYSPPSRPAWHNYEPLSIPQVVRFIYSSSDTYDSDGFPDGITPPVDDYWWQIIELKSQDVSPFLGQDIVFMQLYKNGILQTSTSTFSSRHQVYDYVSNTIKPVFANFSLGMKFRFVYPNSLPIDWLYQSPDGVVSDGFYCRYTGAPAVPF